MNDYQTGYTYSYQRGISSAGAVAKAITTAALIIAIAMLGCAVIEYMAFTADGEEPSSIEQEAGPATLDIQRISLMRL